MTTASGDKRARQIENLTRWLQADTLRWQALTSAAKLQLNDWCLAAGFVRSLVWDKLHNKKHITELTDIDLVYFDSTDTGRDTDRQLEALLKRCLDLPWSVKNQARMHRRNDHTAYLSTADAMSYWPEQETAVGVSLNEDQSLTLSAPFGLDSLFAGQITFNAKSNLIEFERRIKEKRWLTIWPSLQVVREKQRQQ